MKKILAVLIGLAACSAVAPQTAAIDIPNFRALEAKAKDCVNITLGPWVLHSMLLGIQSIQVRSFEFDLDNAYSAADIDAVRRQLNSPGWKSLMKVHDRTGGADVDMYMLIQNDQTRGFALIASEPRAFTIINIIGSIDVSKLPMLLKQLQIGKLAGQDVLAKWPAAAQL